MIIAVNFEFKQLERRSLKKNQGFKGIRTRDLRDTGAMLYQLSYEATHWERGHGFESRWSPDFFFRLLLSNCLNWKFTAMITLHFHPQPQFKYELFHINFTLKIIFPSRVLASSDESPCRNLTFHNVLARQGSSYSNRACFNFKEAVLRCVAWKGYRVRQKMTYHFSFCQLNSAFTGRNRLSMCRISKAIIFLFSGKTQWQMFLSLGRTQTWHLHTKLYKFGWHTSENNAQMKNSRDLILGEVVNISIIYRIPVSWLCPLNGLSFDHGLVKTENYNKKWAVEIN